MRLPSRLPTTARLREIVASSVEAAGYDLEHLSAKPVGRRYLLRIVVDSDTGVDLDAIAELSRTISGLLDQAEAAGEEIIPGEYDLEVGSPGIERPLTTQRHWRRNAGRVVRVRAGGQQVLGRIVEVDADGVVLEVEGAARRFTFADLGPGRVQVEFSHLVAEDGDETEVGDETADVGDGRSDDGIDDEGEDEE